MSERACFWTGEISLLIAFAIVCKRYPSASVAIWLSIQVLYWLAASLKGGL